MSKLARGLKKSESKLLDHILLELRALWKHSQFLGKFVRKFDLALVMPKHISKPVMSENKSKLAMSCTS